MGKIKEKVYDWKNRLQDRHMLTLVVVFISIIVIIGLFAYKKQRDYKQMTENDYNFAFYELVDYVEEVETYLAKSLVSSSPEHGAETLTYVWREANLAQSYLSRLPISSNELSKTAKFLNQVSDYSYALSRKNIYNEPLTEEDHKNLKELHSYAQELKNTLNQLSSDINEGRIKWGELNKKGTNVFAQQVSNISKDSFSNLEENFHEYAGLIYDGAFSEHMTNPERKGLTGEDITEEQAKKKAEEIIGREKIKELNLNSVSNDANIPSYDFVAKIDNSNDANLWLSISKKGGHVVYINYNREINEEKIENEKAVENGKKYLEKIGITSMKETYYMKENGILTINYAYNQNNVIVYPDLVKVKVALDNGEILGIETTGYLNSHEERKIEDVKITKEKAKQTLNKDLEILAEGLAIIPTEYQTEILCYEFKGKVEDREFLVYINASTGKEEDILVIINTPNGTLTM